MNAIKELRKILWVDRTALQLCITEKSVPVSVRVKAAEDYARLQKIEQERDAAVSDLQDAVDFVYGVYGESNETLAAITTAHWRAIIKNAALKGTK